MKKGERGGTRKMKKEGTHARKIEKWKNAQITKREAEKKRWKKTK